jgi:hypothetical protein
LGAQGNLSSGAISAVQAQRAIKEQEATLVFKSRQSRDRLKILYRGTHFSRATEQRETLWLTENFAYATTYAVTDPVNGTIDPAISIYVISEKEFNLLRESGDILTNRDYRRMLAGKELLYLNQQQSLEWAFNSVAQSALLGPKVVSIPTNFTER